MYVPAAAAVAKTRVCVERCSDMQPHSDSGEASSGFFSLLNDRSKHFSNDAL